VAEFFVQASATVLGAVIAAIVAFVLARQSNTAIEKRDAHQRKQSQKSALLRLQTRASILASDVASTMKVIDIMLAEANAAGRTGWPKHARITSIIGSFETIEFPIEELEPLVEAKEFDLIQGLVEISMRHKEFSTAISTYSQLRLDLKNKVTISRSDGNVLSAELSQTQLQQLQPYLIELETLIDQAISMGRGIEKRANSLVQGIGPAARKFLADNTFPKITIHDASQA